MRPYSDKPKPNGRAGSELEHVFAVQLDAVTLFDSPKLESVQSLLELARLADESALDDIGVDKFTCVGVVPRLCMSLILSV
jgi:hypothetical protein